MVKERQASQHRPRGDPPAPGADVARRAARACASCCRTTCVVLTQAELVAHERHYWEEATPIGFIFAFGSLMGLIVGMVIVYQILFSDIASHLREYATLKAMGYSNFYLARVVMARGADPGGARLHPRRCAVRLALRLGRRRDLPAAGHGPRARAAVFAMIFAMCAAAGLLAMRKLRDANPADMF